ncbi:hypothetical protein [Pelagibius sp.]|uniref:hypothetical protein n=1 Tax=Pelagibius sp. TaxID=1931238 RepID=UPI003B50CABA
MQRPKEEAADDIRHRDLSQIPEDEMSPEEKRELRRRFEEFVGLMRRPSVADKLGARPSEKTVRPWDPATAKKRHPS